jgi:fumarate hydratase subunit alpha
VLHASTVADAVRAAIPQIATTLRPDALEALRRALGQESTGRGRSVLGQLIENAEIARSDAVPLCQDTGTVWVRVDVGIEECLLGDLQGEIDAAVAEAYREARLRMSTVRDALLDRSNAGDNTPAFVEVGRRAGTGATVSIMLKGGGSDNASIVRMLRPADGWAGVRAVVLDAVTEKGASACPPLLVGVGVGGTFDSVGGLAKQELLRAIGDPPGRAGLVELERELLAAVNATGIGPGGLGGDITALAVNLGTAPSHIAALPVAVNLGCYALRSATVEVAGR